MIKFYKSGDQMGIASDCTDCDKFMEEFAAALAALIEDDRFKGDWEFQLTLWIPAMVELCCKLRGYKSNVTERRWLMSGPCHPVELVAEFDERATRIQGGSAGITYPDGDRWAAERKAAEGSDCARTPVIAEG